MHWKTLIVVSLLLAWTPDLFAEEFEIRNFKKDPSDVSAIRSSRKDVNGQACAILKVRTDLSGLSFECNQGLTGDPEHKTGEVWLYISPREKRIKFMKEGFMAKDYVFPEPIKAATVYTIELTNKYKNGQDVPLSMGFVLLKSTPSGAEVTLNGEPTGMKTPFSKPLPLGNHQFGLNKEFYHPHQDDFEITAGKTTTIEITLTANFGSLSITSQPESEAEIWIDGQSTGRTTPASFEMLSAGNHTLTLKKEMFEALIREFSINSGQETKLNLSMTPTFGSFSISTTPPAEIWIDQTKVGTGTYSDRLLKGLHIIEAKLDKHNTITESVTIEIDKPLSFQWQMVPKTGTLAINTNPPEANVYLDGTLKGTSPFFIENVIIGEHMLRFTKTGYGEVSNQISLKENQTLEITEKLPTGIEVTINSTPSGAEVWIDGIKEGITPLSMTLSFRSYTIKLTKEDYQDVSKFIEIDKGETEYKFSLSPTIFTISIHSLPNKADVWIDGRKEGITPLSKALPLGNHIFKLNKANYQEISQSVYIDGTKTEFSFILSKIPKEPGTFTDSRDRKKYKYVKIGSQYWMAENLNFRSKNSWCYENKKENCDTYGRLYFWESATKACPRGWHLPGAEDWSELIKYLGGLDVAGGKMKKTRSAHWLAPNASASKNRGFAALLSGYRSADRTFRQHQKSVSFWSSNERSTSHAWYWMLSNNREGASRSYAYKVCGFSVRCVRD